MKDGNRSAGQKALSTYLPIVTALIALVGVSVGASLNYFFARRSQEEAKLLELRSTAYIDFLRGQAKLQEARQLQKDGRDLDSETLIQDYRQIVKEARLRIGAVGSGALITAAAEYFLLTPPQDTCDTSWQSDLEIYKEMRRDLQGSEASGVDDDLLYFLLFDCRPPRIEAARP